MNDDNYNQAIAALKAGEDPGYDAWNGGHMSTMGAESYDLEQGYEDALYQQQQQQQQNNQPTINVNLPESYGGGGQPAQAASGGGYAPQQGPSLADRISAYSSRAGY